MKMLTAFAILVASTSSFSASNSSINDLMYLPEAGTIFGSSTLNYLKYSDTFFDGLDERRLSSKGYIIIQNIGYAPLDNLSLSMDLTYNKTESKTSGEDGTEVKGFGDIRLNGRYRLLDSENRLDLLGNFSYSPDDSVVDSDGDSNGYTGGDSVSVGAEYGVKKDNYQWSLSALYTYNFEATFKDEEFDSTTKDDAHSGIAFAASLLTQLSEQTYIRNFGSANFDEEFEDDDNTIISGSSTYTIGSELQQLLSKDVFLKGGFTAYLPGNGSSTVIMLYHVGANYQF